MRRRFERNTHSGGADNLQIFNSIRKAGIIECPYKGSAFLKLNQHFLAHDVAGQTVIVPTADASFHGLVQGNKTLSAIVECLSADTTEQEIVNNLCDRFDGNRADIEADVHEAVNRLREIGAIDE